MPAIRWEILSSRHIALPPIVIPRSVPHRRHPRACCIVGLEHALDLAITRLGDSYLITMIFRAAAECILALTTLEAQSTGHFASPQSLKFRGVKPLVAMRCPTRRLSSEPEIPGGTGVAPLIGFLIRVT